MPIQNQSPVDKADRLYLHLLLFFSLLVFAVETTSYSIKIGIASLLSLAVVAIGFRAVSNPKSINLTLQRIALAGLCLAMLVMLMPISDGNPFHSLNLEAAGCALAVFVSWISYSVSFARDAGKKTLHRFLFWFPLLALGGLQMYYVFMDFSEIQPTDHARHLGNALVLYDLMVSGESGKFFHSLFYYDFYQPLVYLSSLPFLLFFGKSYSSACLGLILFWFPLAYYFLWQICRRFWRMSAGETAFACLILLGSLLPTSMLKQYMQDFPILALAIITYYSIANSGFFRDRSKSIVAGMWFGLGMLAKANFLLIGLGLCIVPLIRAYRKKQIDQVLYHFGTYLFIGFAILLSWLSVNHAHYNFNLAGMRDFAGVQNLPPANTIASAVWYWVRLPGIWGWPVFLLLLIGVAGLRKAPRSKYLIYQSVVALVFVVLAASTVRNKDLRSLLPLAMLALPLVYGIVHLPNPILKMGTMALLTFLTLTLNVFYATGYNRLLPSRLCPENYAIPTGPLPPFASTPTQDWYVFRKLYSEHFVDSAAFSIGQGTTIFTDRSYGSMYKPEAQVSGRETTDGKVIRFYKDHFWPDYFLFSFSRMGDSLFVELKGKQARMKGDIMFQARFLDSTNQQVGQAHINVMATAEKFFLPLVASANAVVYSFKTHHLHPEAQKEALVYRLNRQDYHPMFVTLDCIRNGGTRVADDTIQISDLMPRRLK